MLCADLVELQWVDGKGRRRRSVANLEDISAAGACLQVETPIPLNTDISLHLPDDDFKGTIRYCVHREIGYYLGMVNVILAVCCGGFYAVIIAIVAISGNM